MKKKKKRNDPENTKIIERGGGAPGAPGARVEQPMDRVTVEQLFP